MARSVLSSASEENALGTRSGAGLNVLFFLRSVDYDRVFESLIRAMLARGHNVLVALDHSKRGLAGAKSELFDGLSMRHAGFAYEQLPPRSDVWLIPASAIRRRLEYLARFDAEAAGLPRADDGYAPPLLRLLLRVPPFGSPAGRRLLQRMLRGLEAAMPIPRAVRSFIERQAPDVVLVSPLVASGSAQGDYIRAAQAARIPAVFAAADWHNLGRPGVLRDVPTLTLAWNQVQVDEAVRLQGLPEQRVLAVGAHPLDPWFDRTTVATPRQQFAAKLRLDPDRPLLVYVDSAGSHDDETAFVKTWLSRLREDPRLRDATVMLRPRTDNIGSWLAADLSESGKTVIWPLTPGPAATPEDRQERFDSLHHARAVIGGDDDTLIEAAIVGRPVLRLTGDPNGQGFPIVAGTWEEHLDQLAQAVESPDLHRERVSSFAMEVLGATKARAPSAPRAAEALEALSPTDVEVPRSGRLLRPVLWLLTPLLVLLLPLLRPRATARAVVRAVRRLYKRLRKLRRVISRRLKAQRIALRVRRREAKARAANRSREKAEAARLEAKAKAGAARKQAKERALAAKLEEKQRLEAAKREEAARAQEARERHKTRAIAAQAAKEQEKARLHAEKKAVAAHAKEAGSAATPPEETNGKGAAAPNEKPVPAAAPTKKRSAARKPLKKRVRRVNKLARGRVKVVRRRWKLTKRGVRRIYNRRYRHTYRSTIMRVPARDELPALLNARQLFGRGAEIGVKTGLYSNELLSNWKGKELISIDPWLSADPEEYVDRSNVSQDEFERYYQQACERLSRHGSRSAIWRKTSVEAAETVEDHSFDFVYIDARHDYASVMEDLEAWCSKVRPGGILAGHDYVDGDFPQGEFYVKSAVDEFFGVRGIPVHGTEGPSAVELFPTWIVEVPEEGIWPTAKKAPEQHGSQPAAEKTGERNPV